MSFIQTIQLIFLAALWGGSFLFMRIAVPDFGPLALIELRAGIAALFLLPFILYMKKMVQVRSNIKDLFFVGITSTALPFCLLSYSTLYVTAGYASILNATTPIFAAVVGWVWLQQSLSKMGLVGLVVGFLGVVVLVFDPQVSYGDADIVPVLTGLLATFSYGVATNYTQKNLKQAEPIVIAFGSQFFAAILLMPLAYIWWPEQSPSMQSWVAVSILGVACTGIAFIVFFSLIGKIGANKSVTVTYLIPFFAVLWGAMLLDEKVSSYMLLGCMLILTGVTLSTGILNALGTKKASKNSPF